MARRGLNHSQDPVELRDRQLPKVANNLEKSTSAVAGSSDHWDSVGIMKRNGMHETGGLYNVGDQDGIRDGDFLERKSHMNPEADPFVPRHQEGPQKRQQHRQPVSAPPTSLVPTVNSDFLHFQAFPPSNHSLHPIAPIHPQFDPYFDIFSRENPYPFDIPSVYYPYPPPRFPLAPMSGQARNGPNGTNWAYPPQQFQGPVAYQPFPIQTPARQQENNWQGMQSTPQYNEPQGPIPNHQGSKGPFIISPDYETGNLSNLTRPEPNSPQKHKNGITINIHGKQFEIPIDDGARLSIPPNAGVLKLANIPYNISKQEVIHLMGRKAKLLPQQYGTPVHIIMDRSTAKTMDCYVEFMTIEDAKETLDWLNRGLPGAPPRLGERHVDIEMSSQDELLKDLFPRAKCIVWKSGQPVLMPNTDRYSIGFQSFLTKEEIFCMMRNAEMPKRAPFASKCPQRTYEALISTLYKFPWHATTLFTVEDRNALHFATFSQLQTLAHRANEKNTLGLDSRLLLDLLNAGLRCPTFNDRQKAALYSAAGDVTSYKATPEHKKFWPFDTLVCKPTATKETMTTFARLISASIERKKPDTDIIFNKWNNRPGITSPFGPVWLEFGVEKINLKWNQAVEYETKVLRSMMEEGLKTSFSAPPLGSLKMAPALQAGGPQFENQAWAIYP